jgi:biofilm PGA synthesis lipoprotein PgaB
LEVDEDGLVQYGEIGKIPRQHFVSWAEIREMQASGLVEIASHTYDSHHGVIGNPQGNIQPALVSRIYDKKTKKYETESVYKKRVQDDLFLNSAVIEAHTGIRPRVMVWPYGAYNGMTLQIAKEAGMPFSLTLDDGYASVSRLSRINRLLISKNVSIGELSGSLYKWVEEEPVRAAHIDLDYIYDRNPVQQAKNLDKLLDRLKRLSINTVYLQAFADPDGDGTADALYFKNRHLPMRADLFNRVAWQIYGRANVEMVYAWMPVLSFDIPKKQRIKHLMVHKEQKGKISPSQPDYRRLSPFHPEAKRIIGEIYEDMAKHAWFNGVLFQDDAYLNDFEDANPKALDYYAAHGLPRSIAAIRKNPKLMQRWTHLKSKALVDFTDYLMKRVRRYRLVDKTARDIYAEAVLHPYAEEWYAQSLELYLKHYDYPVVMAYPYMENANSPERWLLKLRAKIAAYPNGLKKTVFKLQTVDWRYKERPIPTSTLVKQIRLLYRRGALNIAYYPDDFVKNHPKLKKIMGAISTRNYPFLRR